MASKRNLIEEITGIRSRTEFRSRHDLIAKLEEVEHALFDHVKDDDFSKHLIKYVPIAIVSCFEAFFRSIVSELVDFGSPFSDNVLNFNQAKNVKFDFDIIHAIQKKKVTVGEFISHILSFNNLDDINSNISTLTGLDFFDSIKGHNRKTIWDDIRDNATKFNTNFSEILLGLKEVFMTRHVYCHEFGNSVSISKETALNFIDYSKIFLNQTNDFLWQLLENNPAETQMEMNMRANNDFTIIDEKLSLVISTIKNALEKEEEVLSDEKTFDKIIKEWKRYRQKKAELDASIVKGGSLYPLIYSNSMTVTTEEKIESLKTEYSFYLRKLNIL